MTQVVGTAVAYGTHFMQVIRVADRYIWLEDYARDVGSADRAAASVPRAIRHGIDLQRVSFAYPGTERAILKDVSLRLPAGSVVALVGENGAGKTTLVKFLTRLYSPTAGEITVAGVPLQDLPLDEWRGRVSTAFQDFMKFELPQNLKDEYKVDLDLAAKRKILGENAARLYGINIEEQMQKLAGQPVERGVPAYA